MIYRVQVWVVWMYDKHASLLKHHHFSDNEQPIGLTELDEAPAAKRGVDPPQRLATHRTMVGDAGCAHDVTSLAISISAANQTSSLSRWMS